MQNIIAIRIVLEINIKVKVIKYSEKFRAKYSKLKSVNIA